MRGLPAISSGEALRTRRWDAVVLGTALPGLVAAILLGRHGARVLVLEEEAAGRLHPALREPFFTTAAVPDEVLGACLRALGVPLIDQRRIAADPLAYQVVLPDARVDVGELDATVEEWVSWGFADRDDARRLLRALAQAARVEREAMLASPVVRLPRRRVRGGRRGAQAAPARPAPPEATRGLPEELASVPDGLQPVFDAQLRALSNLAATPPPAEARARLLGAALAGGGRAESPESGVRPVLRRRIEALHGEFRSLRGPFRLVTAASQPGVAVEGGEVWVGRLLVLNAPRPALAEVVDQDPLPDLLGGPQPSHRRLGLHYSLPREVLPEGMARRLIALRDPALPAEGTNVVAVQVLGRARDPATLDLVASAVVPVGDPDLAARESEIEAALRELVPFCEDRLRRERTETPRWDCDGLLADPRDGAAWPRELELRLSARPPIFALERSGLAALGFEGDLLLGWRAGTALAAELQ